MLLYHKGNKCSYLSGICRKSFKVPSYIGHNKPSARPTSRIKSQARQKPRICLKEIIFTSHLYIHFARSVCRFRETGQGIAEFHNATIMNTGTAVHIVFCGFPAWTVPPLVHHTAFMHTTPAVIIVITGATGFHSSTPSYRARVSRQFR